MFPGRSQCLSESDMLTKNFILMNCFWDCMTHHQRLERPSLNVYLMFYYAYSCQSKLRGQKYDGASNMSGQYKSCQAKVCEKQPLAHHVHCGAHYVNLVSQSVGEGVIRDVMATLQELDNLFSQSIKCQCNVM
jgi:hypothetical protein